MARYAPLNALAILVGSQTGRGGVLTQCSVEEGLGLRLAPASFEVGAHDGCAVAHLETPDGTTAVEVMSVAVGIDAFAAVARVRAPT